MRAYTGGQAQKHAIAQDIAAAIADGRFLGDGDDRQDSLVTLIAGKRDPRAYEDITGVPGGLGLLADEAIMFQGSDPDAARAFALAWIDGPQVGADLTSVPGKMAAWLLDEAAKSGIDSDNPDVGAMLAEVRELHQSLLAGVAVERSTWSTLRRRAIATTDSLAERGPMAMSKLIETLAWPPLASRTILVEALRIFRDSIMAGRSNPDMTDAERDEIERTMEALLAETTPEREADPDNYWFPDIFKARLPETYDRFVADLELSKAARRAVTVRCAEYAAALMREAAVLALADPAA